MRTNLRITLNFRGAISICHFRPSLKGNFPLSKRTELWKNGPNKKIYVRIKESMASERKRIIKRVQTYKNVLKNQETFRGRTDKIKNNCWETRNWDLAK